MTFPETQTICDGMSVAGHSLDEINAVNDLKNAWRWIFDNIDAEVGIESLCVLNRAAGRSTVINAGQLRDRYDEPIRVPLHDGKDFYPPLPPSKEVIDEDIRKIVKDASLESALDLFCHVSKGQFFNDGNKRTATLISNLFMIQNGMGILSIPVEKKFEFYDALTSYYEDDGKKEALKQFFRKHCLTGTSDRNTDVL